MDYRPKTIFVDLDGTMVKHTSPVEAMMKKTELEILPGVIEKLLLWDQLGYNIIITTGRKEGLRKATVKQLEQAGIIYDQIVMGIGGGDRVLINDAKPDKPDRKTAIGITVTRNEGLDDITV